ncbi:MAG: hypothetical protein JOZ41_11025, partial [Chloroflexi bacterium]|nr:hypothetical protein [Chloroflexota bacterium]
RRVFDQVSQHNQPVIVERNGERFRLQKEESTDIWADYDPESAREALRGAAGILAGMDIDELVAEIYAQRDQDSTGRPA